MVKEGKTAYRLRTEPITGIRVISNRAKIRVRSNMKSNGYIISEEHNVIYYTGTTERRERVAKAGASDWTAYPSASAGQFRSFFQHHITTTMQYGQIVFLLFVAMVFYYAAMIFMDFQRAKAAQNAEQDSHKEEDIDISEEARSFRPIRINRDEPESKEENQEENNTGI